MADGQVVFEITADGKHAVASIKDVTAAIEKETKKWDKAAGDASGSMESGFVSAIKKISAAISAAKIGQALLNFGKEAVEAASALQEVQNVVDVTFGKGSAQIDSWAKTAGKQFGLTETQAKKFASTMGAMMKSSGIAGDEIVGMSKDLAGLAADMASFYNMDFETAFQKIRSGISGETEPLKQLGINMSVANLEAFALTKGITKAYNSMSQGEQTMLRYQYLMQATADAQGDFARTSDGYANSMRKMETNIEGIKTKLGGVLLPEVSKTVSALNDMLEKIAPTPEETVMDQLAGVQLKTAEKLEEIGKTAEQARALTQQLSAIENTKAGGSVQDIVDKLSTVDLSQGNIGVFNEFLATLYANIEDVASVRGESVEEAKAWLDGLADSANKLDPSKGEDWKALLEAITGGLPGLEDTEGGQSIVDALELESGAVKRYLDALGIDSSNVADKQALWLEVCKRLVQTIPGLSSIIDTNTGEVKGGIQAINDYIDEWEAASEKAALLEEIAQERKILSERYSDRFTFKVDVVQAEANVERLRKKLAQFSQDVKDSANNKDLQQSIWGGRPNYTQEEQEYLDTVVALSEAEGDLATKQQRLTTYTEEYDSAVANVNEREQAVIDKFGEITEEEQKAADGAAEWSDETKKAASDAVTAAQEALKGLGDYTKGVFDSVRASIDSAVKGFEKITRPTTEYQSKVSDLIQKQQECNRATKEGEQEYQRLQNEIDELNKQAEAYQPKGMEDALKSQAAFLDEYLQNMEKVQQMGLSNELLASLSDGSVASGEYLSALVSDPAAAKRIDELYQQVQGKKDALANALGQQKLTVDEMYKQMVKTAKEAVAGLDLEGAAAENSGKTIAGLASGISSHVSEVSSAVDSILAELNRLSGWGINIDLGSFGSFGFSMGNLLDGSHETGLNYVPFDGYLAELHEGEGILTAEENRIWQRFKNGGMTSAQGGVSGSDLDAILGSNLQGVKAGGNVYLDGRTVGEVVSARQGRQYRTLQRSGWQQ